MLAIVGCARKGENNSLTPSISNDDPTLRIDFPAAETRLREKLQAGEVDRLLVFQIHRGTLFRINVSSSFIERNYDYLLENRRIAASSIGSNVLSALQQAQPRRAERVADLRWGFVFCGSDGSRVFSVFCDGDGKRGIINGACYTFETAALAELADSLFPLWMK